MKILKSFISVCNTILNEFKKATFKTFFVSIITTLGFPSSSSIYKLKNGISLIYTPKTLDVMVIRECFINNLYTKFIKDKKLHTVLDLGSHKGYSVLGLLNTGVKIDTIICVEPLIENIRTFKKNLVLNKKVIKNVKKIIVHQYAISSKKGKAKFYITQDSVGHSLSDPSVFTKVIATRAVKLTTPQHILKKAVPDLVKFDIEGEEFQIFKSSQLKYLMTAKYIVMEVHPSGKNTLNSIKEKLKSYKYNIKTPNNAWPNLIFAYKTSSSTQ